MGKKSKQKRNAAKAKSGASGAVAPAAASELGSAGRSSGSGGIGKKARCVSCLALVKEASKGHACPGCSDLYCWRCERKDFLSCPNQSKCPLPFLRRCSNCVSARTMKRELSAAGEQAFEGTDYSECFLKAPGTRHRDMFEDIVKGRDDLALEALPFAKCGSYNCSGEILSVIECFRCFEDPYTTKLFRCSLCWKGRCRPCVEASREQSTDAMIDLHRAAVASNTVDISCSNLIEQFGNKISAIPDAMTGCKKCRRNICYECLNSAEIRCLAKRALTVGKRVTAGERVECERSFQCSRCYWSAKPCTNPTCPNEVGIPTKRCGGCHLDRYCSVECQAAAYPDHMQKCKKIQAKRDAAAGKEGREE